MRHIIKSIFLLIVLNTFFTIKSQETIIIQADKVIANVQPTMWGIFFEDINFALDGGLYAELVKNRSFEFEKPIMGWKEIKESEGIGALQFLNREKENPNNPRYLRIIKNQESGLYGIVNEGFRGMGIKNENTYNLSLWAKNVSGDARLKIEIISSEGNVIASSEIKPDSENWKKYSESMIASRTDSKAQLRLTVLGKGVIDIDFVSLFPKDTWKNRPGGLRADLVELLAKLKPGFVRFPGGCIVEGRNLAERYQWKKTINNIEDRKLMFNRWNIEFLHRPTPDYFQTFGVGFYEYFLLSEDLNAEPLPVLSCGMACQFNTGELAQLEDMQPFIQDALDLIEFANGDTTTFYGHIRSQMGHPAPFNMHYIGVGNEQWGPQYIERYKMMSESIQKAHPEIKIIGSVGPSAGGEQFDYLWGEMNKLKPNMVDEHYYMSPDWFLKNAKRYDSYNRKGPKIFVGEFAAQSVGVCSPENRNSWKCAISEASFMTGLERNADIIHMASYAPLFGHVEAWQWKPNLIWFDNLRSVGTINYEVMKLFSEHRGNKIVSATINNSPITGDKGVYASASLDEKTQEIILKIVNVNDQPHKFNIQMKGIKIIPNEAQIFALQSSNPDAEKNLENPTAFGLKTNYKYVKDNKMTVEFPASSVNFIRIGY
jgi:alpha-N-arabinofuranosidase